MARKIFTVSFIFGIIMLILAIFKYGLPELKVVFLDVGQGDSALIKAPNGQIVLIDGGPDNKVLRGLGKNLPFYHRNLDFLVISHYHDDHITGLIEIIRRYRVKALIYSGKIPDSPLILDLLEVASQYKVELRPINSQVEIIFGPDCRLNFLNPGILVAKDDSNESLVARLNCDNRSFLFAGDNGAALESAIINSGWSLKADVFKASHHGSNTSNSLSFLEKVAPHFIVVSVGTDNRFGHPGPFFLERAAALGIPVKRTDQDGDIKIFAK